MYEFSDFMKAANESVLHPALEECMIQPVDAFGTSFVIGDTVAEEGLFFDDKKPPQWIKEDMDLVRKVGIKGKVIIYPSEKWPKEFFERNSRVRGNLLKNGTKYIADYVALLATAMQEYQTNKEKIVAAINANDIEAYQQATEKLFATYKQLAEKNQTKDIVVGGEAADASDDFKKKIVPILERYQKVFDAAVNEFYTNKQDDVMVAKIKLLSKKLRQAQARKRFNPNEIVLYCTDLWHILSEAVL